MRHAFANGLIALLVICSSLPAQTGIQRATIRKVDAEKGILIVTADGKDHELVVTDETKIWDAGMKELADRLKSKEFRAGVAVQFKGEEKDGKIVLVGLKLAGEGKPAQPRDPRRAKIKSVDADKMTVTLTIDGKTETFAVTESTRLANVPGESLRDQLRSKELKEGADVLFLSAMRDGKMVLVGMRLGGPQVPPRPPMFDSSKLKPLTELGKDTYHEFTGGLYPDGKNNRPAAHETAGVALAKKVKQTDGKIVMLSVGMSNTTQEFSTFKRLADADQDRNPNLVIVDGAQGGMTAARIRNVKDTSGERFWTTVDQRLKAANVTRDQVQIAWIKEADAGPNQGFPTYAKTLQSELGDIVRLMHTRFPNLKLVYLSSRTYAGYARTALNPEPYAYESGFSVKWLIEQQLRGEETLNFDPARGQVVAPWLSWGPYLWANGTTKRPDGVFYEEKDFGGDGTHPSRAGQEKVAEELLKFFKNDTTAKPWFIRP